MRALRHLRGGTAKIEQNVETSTEGGTVAIDSMMQFRLSYLQLVAFAWEDTRNYDAIVADPDGYSFFTKLNLSRPPWTIALKLSDPLIGLPESGYAPAATGGWIGPRAQLTIEFPNPPENPDDAPAAMAAYYAALPSPFGEAGLTPDAISTGAGGHGMGHMSDAFVLGGVIVRALAISWSNSSFRDSLISGTRINDAAHGFHWLQPALEHGPFRAGWKQYVPLCVKNTRILGSDTKK
jgi:ribosomally synthesized peptide (two-chain TOMM family)